MRIGEVAKPAGFSLHPLPAVRPPLAGCVLVQSCLQRVIADIMKRRTVRLMKVPH